MFKNNGCLLELLQPGVEVMIKWAASPTCVAREIHARVTGFVQESRMHTVRYVEDGSLEKVNLMDPTQRRPLWYWFNNDQVP